MHVAAMEQNVLHSHAIVKNMILKIQEEIPGFLIAVRLMAHVSNRDETTKVLL